MTRAVHFRGAKGNNQKRSYNTSRASDRLESKPFRIRCNRRGNPHFPASDFIVDDRFDFAFGGVDRLSFTQQSKTGAKMPEFKPFARNVQIQFNISRKCSIAIVGNHDDSRG